MTTLTDLTTNATMLAQASLVEGLEGFVTSTEFLIPLASFLTSLLTAIVTALFGPIFGTTG